MIDNSYQLETAEGIDIDIVPAGLAVRTYAFAIDLSIRFVIIIGFAFIFDYFGEFGTGMLWIMLFIVEWFYPILFEISRGATPGKSAFGLRVIYDNGLPITFSGSLTRNLFRFVDILPFAYVIGATSIVLNQKSKRLGDIVAGTTVVYVPQTHKTEYFNFEREAVNMPVMTTEQQQLIIAFAKRAKRLSAARQIELADAIAPVIGIQGEDAIKKIKNMAAILLGQA